MSLRGVEIFVTLVAVVEFAIAVLVNGDGYIGCPSGLDEKL